MPKTDFTKLDKQYNQYKKKILNIVNKECNNKQAYLDSFADTYTGWKVGVYSEKDIKLN